jgi:toxin ParE1/3/4
MRYDYIVSDDAEKDLREIFDFIALDNRAAASKLTDHFEEAFERLASMPRLGLRKIEWTKRDVRFLAIKKYFVVYKVNEDAHTIVILRVLSTFRDIADIVD